METGRRQGGEGYPAGFPPLRQLPPSERPRELFTRVGPENVATEVLLALLLRSNVRGLNVVELSRRLLWQYGSLTALGQATVDELGRCGLPGMGLVKAQVLKAAIELAHRVSLEAPGQPSVRTPAEAAQVLREAARLLEVEKFWVLPLDTKHRLRRPAIEITRGLVDASLVHPREVFREAIRASSTAIVLVHNHPSGDPAPSAEDIRITRQLVQSGQIVDIQVLDHVILGRVAAERAQDYFSLREAGLVDFAD